MQEQPVIVPQEPSPFKVINELEGEDVFQFNSTLMVFQYNLEEPFRYQVTFETDLPVEFFVYDHDRFNQWKETGGHTFPKIWSKDTSGTYKTSLTKLMDINNKESGVYYFVFNIIDVKEKPQKGKLTIVKMTSLI
mgnify:CR=1 FL=1